MSDSEPIDDASAVVSPTPEEKAPEDQSESSDSSRYSSASSSVGEERASSTSTCPVVVAAEQQEAEEQVNSGENSSSSSRKGSDLELFVSCSDVLEKGEEPVGGEKAGSGKEQQKRFFFRLPEFGSKSAKKPKLLSDDLVNSPRPLSKFASFSAFSCDTTKNHSVTPTTIDVAAAMMDPPTPTPMLRSSGRFGKLNTFLPKFGKNSAEYQLSSTSPVSNKNDVTIDSVDSTVTNGSENGVKYPTYRRRQTEDDPPEAQLVAPLLRAPIVEPEKAGDETDDSGVENDKNDKNASKTVSVQINASSDDCANEKHEARNGESVAVAMEEVSDQQDEIDTDDGVEKGSNNKGKQWNWFLPGRVDRQRRHEQQTGTATTTMGSIWGGFPKIFGFKAAEDNDHEDSPKKSLVDKSSTATTPSGDEHEVTRPLTADHHENSTSPLIAADHNNHQGSDDSLKKSQEDIDEDKKTAAKILTSTPQKNGKMKTDAKNGHDANERLKIGDETVLTIVGDNDATDGNGTAEEKLKLTENIEGEPNNGHSKNGGTIVNGSPKKKAAVSGGKKFKLPEWLWKPKSDDERRPPGEGSARGLAREKRRLYMGLMWTFIIFLLILVIALFATLQHIGDGSSAPLAGASVFIDTDCGKVRGLAKDGGIEYLGIPYAEPPSGPNRWKRSYPPSTPNIVPGCPVVWGEEVVDSTAEPPAKCTQVTSAGEVVGQEDCLTLDIFAPRTGTRIKYPVVVFISAETLNGGDTNITEHFDFPTLAGSGKAIFVVPRFRLSALGFLTLGDLTKEAGKGESGNYALSDILASLDWVQKNVAKFGGSPESVTLVGHLAGGSLVTALTAAKKELVTATKEDGSLGGGSLFHRVWVASGGSMFANESLYISEALNSILKERVKCRTLECLRTRNDTEILKSVPENRRRFWFSMPPEEDAKLRRSWLVVDGGILKSSPFSAWEDENYRTDVPIVFGTTKHAEIRPWTAQLLASTNKDIVNELNTTSKIRERLEEDFATFEDEVKSTAIRVALGDPASTEVDPRAKYFSLATDIRTKCPLLKLAETAAASFSSPVFFYEASMGRKQRISGNEILPFDVADAYSDVDAIFGAYEAESPEQMAFASSLQAAFFEFVKTGQLPEATPVGDGGKIYEFGERMSFVDPREVYAYCDTFLQSSLYPSYARMD